MLRARADVSLVVQYWLLPLQAAVDLSGAREVLSVTQLRHLWLRVRLIFLNCACGKPATECSVSHLLTTAVVAAEPAQEVYEERRQENIRNIAIIAHGASWRSSCPIVVQAATLYDLTTRVPQRPFARL